MLFPIKVQRANGTGIKGALISSTPPAVGEPGPWQGLTEDCGWFMPDLGPGRYHVEFSAPGFKSDTRDWVLGDPPHEPILVALEPSTVWPAGLHNWRGAFCIPNALPGQPVGFGDRSRIWTPAYGTYPDVWRARYLAEYVSRGYTHFVYNIASSDGIYHGDYPNLPDDPVRVRRDLTEILEAGLIPVVVCCDDANGGSVEPYESVRACQDLIPVAFPMWEMNGPLGVDTMVNGQSVGRVGDCCRNTRAALLPETLLYVHFTAGHGAGAQPEGAWWQWFHRELNGAGLLSQDNHWDNPTATAAGLADTTRHLHGQVAGWEGLHLDNVAFECQTTVLYRGRTEMQGLAFMALVLQSAGPIAGFCDSGA